MAATVPTVAAAAPTPLKLRLVSIWESWATRSLMVGAVATVFDLAVGGTLLWLGAPTRFAAMAGVALGALFTFLANRHFAFRDHDPTISSPALRFLGVTFLSMIAHGQVVVWLRDRFGVPYVVSKMAADLVVFTFGQLLLLRFVVFPRPKPVIS